MIGRSDSALLGDHMEGNQAKWACCRSLVWSVFAHRRHGIGKAVAIDRLGEHWGSRDLLMDALDGIAVSVSGDEDNRRVAYFAKPSSDFDPLAASFERNVHQNDIRLVAHRIRVGLMSIGCSIA